LEACESIAKKEVTYNPNFHKRYPGQLESVLFSVNYRSENEYLNLLETAASYFVHIACGHVFLDGNKRFAVTFMVYFLNLNGFDLKISKKTLRNIAIDIAHENSHNISLDLKKEYLVGILKINLTKLTNKSKVVV
jgi:death-on-curing family protein